MGTDKPLGGLEEVFNKALSGKDGSEKYEVGAGNRIPLGDNTTVPAVDGQDLHTTIDRDLQWYTQRVLRQAVETSGGSRGSRWSWTPAPVRSSRWPTTRPSTPTTRAPRRSATGGPARSTSPTSPARWRRCSRCRPLIDEGKVNARTKMLVPGELHRQDRVIHDHWEHGLIKLTLAGVLAKSSNVGTVLASDRFGPGRAPLVPRQVRPRPADQRRARRESRGATCPTRASGTARSATASPSASRSRSTPCRWPPRSTPSPTTASASTRP